MVSAMSCNHSLAKTISRWRHQNRPLHLTFYLIGMVMRINCYNEYTLASLHMAKFFAESGESLIDIVQFDSNWTRHLIQSDLINFHIDNSEMAIQLWCIFQKYNICNWMCSFLDCVAVEWRWWCGHVGVNRREFHPTSQGLVWWCRSWNYVQVRAF